MSVRVGMHVLWPAGSYQVRINRFKSCPLWIFSPPADPGNLSVQLCRAVHLASPLPQFALCSSSNNNDNNTDTDNHSMYSSLSLLKGQGPRVTPHYFYATLIRVNNGGGSQGPARASPQAPSMQPHRRLLARIGALLKPIWVPSSATLHPNYRPFVLWSLTSTFLGSITYVFSTQSIFSLITKDLQVQQSGTVAASVTRWLVRDALGQVGGITGMAVIGKLPDVNHKHLRVMAKVMLHFATWVEITVPRFITGLGATGAYWWVMFMGLSVTTGVFSHMAGIAANAARAHQLSWLSRERAGKIAELTARGSVQATTASLLGTLTGLTLNATWLAKASTLSPWIVPGVAACLMAVSIYATRTSCRYAWQAYLDRAMLPGVLSQVLNGGNGRDRGATPPTRQGRLQIPTPEEYSYTESIKQPRTFNGYIFEPFALKQEDFKDHVEMNVLTGIERTTGLYTRRIEQGRWRGQTGVWIVNRQQASTGTPDGGGYRRQLGAYLQMVLDLQPDGRPPVNPSTLIESLERAGWELKDTMRPGPNSLLLVDGN